MQHNGWVLETPTRYEVRSWEVAGPRGLLGRYLNLSSGVWVSQNSRKTSQGVPATPKTNYPHYFSAAHVQDKNTRCPRIYLPLPCSGWSTVSPPCPTVPVSIMVDRQGIVTIPGLGRPSRRPLPSGVMTSPQGRPGMQSGPATPTGQQNIVLYLAICHAQTADNLRIKTLHRHHQDRHFP